MTAASSPAFLDTNVLVYSLQRTPSSKQAVAHELVDRLMAERRVRVSTQVLQELFVTLTHKARGRWSADEALESLEQLAVWPVCVIDYPAIREACLLARDASLSFWDALIVVAAARSGASQLYTEDLNHGQKVLGVEVINPFLGAS